MIKIEYIKSPLNYTGGKFKLLPQIVPLFPNDINTFVDLFGGGFNVGVNVSANKIIYNDIIGQLIQLLQYWKENDIEALLDNIYSSIKEYGLSNSIEYGYSHYGCNSNDGLSKYNNKQWQKLRKDYNETKNIKLLYPLIIYTFNNNIKFNDKNNFVAGGCNKRDFNKSLKNNFIKFINEMNNKNVEFINKDFRRIKLDVLSKDDLVYCDPPYLITSATYNINWTDKEEIDLINKLDNLNKKGIRFALSNVLESKGKTNDILENWAKDYTIHYLNNTYSNCNYQKNDKESKDIEVLITNY